MGKQLMFKGGWKNSVGVLTGAKWRDMLVIKTKPDPSNPDTLGQQTVRNVFTCLTKLFSYFSPSIHYYTTLPLKSTSVRNDLIHDNKIIFHEFLEDGQNQCNLSSISISKGPLPMIGMKLAKTFDDSAHTYNVGSLDPSPGAFTSNLYLDETYLICPYFTVNHDSFKGWTEDYTLSDFYDFVVDTFIPSITGCYTAINKLNVTFNSGVGSLDVDAIKALKFPGYNTEIVTTTPGSETGDYVIGWSYLFTKSKDAKRSGRSSYFLSTLS